MFDVPFTCFDITIQTSTVEIGTEQQVLEEVTEVQPEITIQEEVDDNIISGEAADHFTSKGGYYLSKCNLI